MTDQLAELVRAHVAEPDMSEAEIQAVVADALEQLGLEQPIPARCACTRPLVFRPDAFDSPRCAYCGRVPA